MRNNDCFDFIGSRNIDIITYLNKKAVAKGFQNVINEARIEYQEGLVDLDKLYCLRVGHLAKSIKSLKEILLLDGEEILEIVLKENLPELDELDPERDIENRIIN